VLQQEAKAMAIEKHHVPVGGEWHDCPACGYEGGWHVFFKRGRKSKVLHMDLQCPGCKQTYDLGIKICLEDK
jgi:hypothetical protein